MYTVEQKAEWKQKMVSIAAQIRSMPKDKQESLALSVGTITCEGHTLSMFNTIFLYMTAGRPLLQVGGFRQWQKVGRKVISGEKAAGYIYVPMVRKSSDTGLEGENSEGTADIRFRLVPVFDINQTEVM